MESNSFIRMRVSVIVSFLAMALAPLMQTHAAERVYEIIDDKPAPNRGADYSRIHAHGYPFDSDWEMYSYPIGNGYMGANIFGRTDVERIQITEKTLANEGLYDKGGLTSFAEIYLGFDHYDPKSYKRSLNLNEGKLFVSYDSDGVNYTREYFANYPENVIVVRLSADKKGSVSFTVDAEIPHRNSANEINTRLGEVDVDGDLITLSGNIAHFNTNYEGQIKVIAEGGQLISQDSNSRGEIRVEKADSVTLLIAAGTNYELSENVFLETTNSKKLDENVFPHEKVSTVIKRASELGYDALRKSHSEDYTELFSRVSLVLSPEVSNMTTEDLLESYKADASNPYLEELMYHFGRYLLISTSRKGAMPCGLQGVWSQYAVTPWTGGYWHNINVQMNYWGAFSGNLGETFIPYLEYFEAYQPKAMEMATEYVEMNNPQMLGKDGESNGWTIGTGSTCYIIGAPGGHSGPGTGGFTTKLLWDYYDFSRDDTYLREIGYPALLGMSRFLSKTLKPSSDGVLLVEPSASPEIRVADERGRFRGPHYVTVGTTFDQGFVWETYNDVLKAADILGAEDEFLDTLREQIDLLDPIIIGSSGQVKEFREEDAYGEIGDPHHRHVSHLCPLYPGTLINSSKPEWVEGVKTALDFRGNNTTGWAMAHRMNLRARTKEAEKARAVYSKFLKERTLPNLWTVHPPFQIDGNLGTMAGVAEMLIQSHEGVIEVLPALPEAWSTGSVSGIVARGNFEVSLSWSEGVITRFELESGSGEYCRIRYPNISSMRVIEEGGDAVSIVSLGTNAIGFKTEKGATYSILLN